MPGNVIVVRELEAVRGARTANGWNEALAARGKRAAFTYEPAALPDGTLAGARPGSGNFSITLRGRSAHAGRNPEDGRNAIVAAADGHADDAQDGTAAAPHRVVIVGGGFGGLYAARELRHGLPDPQEDARSRCYRLRPRRIHAVPDDARVTAARASGTPRLGQILLAGPDYASVLPR